MGPEQSKESKTDLCDQFQDFSRYPFCSKPKMPQVCQNWLWWLHYLLICWWILHVQHISCFPPNGFTPKCRASNLGPPLVHGTWPFLCQALEMSFSKLIPISFHGWIVLTAFFQTLVLEKNAKSSDFFIQIWKFYLPWLLGSHPNPTIPLKKSTEDQSRGIKCSMPWSAKCCWTLWPFSDRPGTQSGPFLATQIVRNSLGGIVTTDTWNMVTKSVDQNLNFWSTCQWF